MTKDKRAIIDNLTSQIISFYNINIPNTNIETLVRELGGTIKKVDASQLSFAEGRIQKTGDNQFTITIDQDQSAERQKFTIAHELGHLFLHMGYQIDEEKWKNQTTPFNRFGNTEQEYEAHEFAASLLMPKDIYIREFKKNITGKTVDIAAIADYFQVSLAAASNRGKWLGLIQW